MDWVNNSLKKAETSVDARASRPITDVISPEKVKEEKETKRKDLLHDTLIKQNISLGKEMEELQKEAQGTVIELQKQNEQYSTEIKRMTIQMETLLNIKLENEELKNQIVNQNVEKESIWTTAALSR